METTGGVSLRIPATLESLALVQDFVGSRGASLGLGAELAARLELVVEELVVNVGSYAYPQGGGDMEVDCLLTPDAARFCLILRDWGVAFAPWPWTPRTWTPAWTNANRAAWASSWSGNWPTTAPTAGLERPMNFGLVSAGHKNQRCSIGSTFLRRRGVRGCSRIINSPRTGGSGWQPGPA